ncbi:hypothetical protein KOAAANKH_03670 [Brevundimonas sp. NIBR10]|nr:hypothetical protein KOAAANKH_03670 [Brevundimonas sp. NIBR10]
MTSSQPYIMALFEFTRGTAFTDSVITITESGVVELIKTGDNPTYGLFGEGANSDLVNRGSFTVRATAVALGVFTADLAFSFENSGTFRVTSESLISWGAKSQNGGIFRNSGLVEVSGGQTAVGFDLGRTSTLENTGTIRVTNPTGTAVGIRVAHLASESSTITNTGLIEANYAIFDASETYSPPQDAIQVVTNFGQIRGQIYLARGADQIVNVGSIVGSITLGAGDDLYQGERGTQSGGVYGGFGDDRLLAGTGSDILYGESGEDILSGASGDDFLGGGRGSDVLDGGAGTDTAVYSDLTIAVDLDLVGGRSVSAGQDTLISIENVYGSRWNDTLRGDTAANLLFGADGADVLIGRDGDDVLVGGTGADVLTGGIGRDTFVFGAGDGTDVITDFRLGGERDTLSIFGYAGYRELRQTSDGALIVLSDTDTILLQGISAANVSAADLNFSLATRPSYAVFGPVPAMLGTEPWQVTASEQVYAGESLAFNNATGGIVVSRWTTGASGYLTNNGQIVSTSTSSGTIGVSTDGAISGAGFTNGTGGRLDAYLTNSTSGRAVGGYFNSQNSVFDNRGSIFVRSSHEAYGAEGARPGLTVSNSGLLDVVAQSSAYGVRLGQYGSFTNTGTIRVEGSGLAVGMYGIGTTSATNSGSIVVVNRTGISVGMEILSDNLIFSNSGLIQADMAVQVGTYFFGQGISFNNSGDLRGGVALSSGADVFVNTGLISGLVALGQGADRFEGAGTIGDLRINGGAGNDQIVAGAGNDVLEGGAGNDTLSGGGGTNTAIFSGTSTSYSITTSGATTTVTGGTDGTDTLTDIELLVFTDRTVQFILDPTNVINGTPSAETLAGGSNRDLITGGGGADTLSGGAGTDVFRYLLTSDSTAAASDIITDFVTGADRIDLTALNPTSVSIARLAGGGTVVFAQTPGGAFQTFAAGTSLNGGDIIFNGGFGVFVIGSEGSDLIQGTSVAEPLVGNGGDDVITGGAGADAIAGGAGRDVFRYVSRGDSNQQTGFDNLYDFTSGEDRIDLTGIGARSISILRTDNGSSFIYAETAQGVFLTTAANRTVQATDITFGGNVNGVGNFGIYMVGSGQADTLVGTILNDPISGGAGDDTITGGGGADALFGDAGADTFVYLSASDSFQGLSDGIFGFVSGTDRLDLRAVRTGAADTFGIAYLSGGSYLFVDLGGNGTSDLVIGLAGTTLVASDILWNTGAIGEEPGVKAAGPEVLPAGDGGDLFDGEMSFELSPMTGRWMLDLEGARGFHGQDWYL